MPNGVNGIYLALGLGTGSWLKLGFGLGFFDQNYSELLPMQNLTVMHKEAGDRGP